MNDHLSCILCSREILKMLTKHCFVAQFRLLPKHLIKEQFITIDLWQIRKFAVLFFNPTYSVMIFVSNISTYVIYFYLLKSIFLCLFMLFFFLKIGNTWNSVSSNTCRKFDSIGIIPWCYQNVSFERNERTPVPNSK